MNFIPAGSPPPSRTDFECDRWKCSMTFRACILRQKLSSNPRVQNAGNGLAETCESLQACAGCTQGRDIWKNHGPGQPPPIKKENPVKRTLQPCFMPGCGKRSYAPLCGSHRRSKSKNCLLSVPTGRLTKDQISGLALKLGQMDHRLGLNAVATEALHAGLEIYEAGGDIEDDYPETRDRLDDCQIPGCTAPREGCNLCRSHYMAARRNQLMRVMTSKMSMAQTQHLITAIGRVAVALEYDFNTAFRALVLNGLGKITTRKKKGESK